VDPRGTPFENGNYGDDSNDGPPDGGNRPPPIDHDGNNGDDGSPPNDDNINASTTVLPRVGTHANLMQANM
jgi:hypothetical protein